MIKDISYEGVSDPLQVLRWANLLDDVNNAHTRIDSHEEHWDEWQQEFDASILQVKAWVFGVLSGLINTVEDQQKQIEELQQRNLLLTNG